MDSMQSIHDVKPVLKSFAVFDLESTSLPSPTKKPKITELSLVALTREELLTGKPRALNKLTLCFNPKKLIDPSASRITGLHNDSLELLPSFSEQVDLIATFLERLPKPSCLIAHNGLRFDFPLLRAELQRAGKQSLDINVVDSLHVFRVLDGEPAVPDFVTEATPPSKHKPSWENITQTPTNRNSSTENTVISINSSNGVPTKKHKPSNVRRNLFDVSPMEVSDTTNTLNAQSGNACTQNTDLGVTNANIKLSAQTGSNISKNTEMGVTNNPKNPKTETTFSQNTDSDDEFLVNASDSFEKSSDKKNNTKPITTNICKYPTSIPPKLSYALPKLYEREFGSAPITSHTSEDDCVTLIKLIQHKSSSFIDYCDEHYTPLSQCEVMYT